MNILTALANNKINEKLKAVEDINILNKDIQYKEGILEYLEKNKNAYDPRKIISSGEFNIKKYIKDKLQLLGNSNRL